MSRVNSHRFPGNMTFLASCIASMHYFSGIALSYIIPAMLWLAYLSLQSTYRFSEVRYWLFHPLGKALVVVTCSIGFFHSFVTLYDSASHFYKVMSRPTIRNVAILIITLYFAGGMGYWLW